MKKALFIIAAAVALLPLVIGACSLGPIATEIAPSPKAATPAVTSAPAGQADWAQTLAAAKKEGQVNLYTPTAGPWQQLMTKDLANKYGIILNVTISNNEGEIAQRILTARKGGVYDADVLMGGSAIFASTYRPQGLLDPLDKELVLPEVTNPKSWWRGALTYLDPDTRTFFPYREYLGAPLVMNTDLFKPGDVKTWDNLLDPKWKGKIVITDPTTNTYAQEIMAMLALRIRNWDFVVRLSQQDPVLVNDTRLAMEWIGHGAYPILVAPNKSEALGFIQQGVPVNFLILEEGMYVTTGAGFIGAVNKRPNPNAARIFINYFLSEEGQYLFCKSGGYQSARADVPTDYLPPLLVRQTGVNYFSTFDKSFLDSQAQITAKVIDLYKPLKR